MPKVLLIGWDAADWKIINPLMDAGEMPALQSLVENGVKGKMATLDPPLSPMLWTSIATGKRPYKHGIHGFTEPTPDGKGIRPIYNTNRKCKAIWNIFTQQNIKSHIVGWWPSHPAEPIKGTMISNFYQRSHSNNEQIWPMVAGTVFPQDKESFYAKLRVHTSEITSAHIHPFVPDFEKVDQMQDNSLRIIAKNIAESASIHCAATHLLEHETWDFAAVYFDAIDHFCHSFMKYHPPYREFISRRDFDLYKDVVNSSYRFHDMILGRYLELIDEDTHVMLISDHGFHPGALRPDVLPDEPTAPALEHSPFGIFVLKGPGIKKDELVFGASLLDVCPTLLSLFDLPIGRDMDGKVLTGAFAEEKKVNTIESWEEVQGEDGRQQVDYMPSEDEMQDELQQLIDLGYIADPGPDIEKAIINTLAENNYNLARAYFNGQKWEEGAEILEKLHDANPEVTRYATYLINAYQIMGKFNKARTLVDQVRGLSDRQSPQLDMLEATLLLAEKRNVKALALFKKVEQEAGNQPQLRLRIAVTYFQMNKFEEAIVALTKAVEEDAEEAASWYMLGACHYQLASYDKALEYLLHSIGLQYYHPPSHYYLGETLFALQKYEASANAFEVCLRLAPFMNMARKKLIVIYDHFLNLPDLAKKYAEELENTSKGSMVIVSGLPRSGTSMMMQMLHSAGLDIFTDGERAPDENNSKGYYEHEAVKNLAKNKTWMSEANGKVVKIITQLLPHLPLNYHYKIIFMERDLMEVISSQQKMLSRLGKKNREDTLPYHLLEQYEATVKEAKQWLSLQKNIEILYVNYSEIIDHPLEVSMQIATFLEETLDLEAMMNAVDPSLRREKSIAHH